MTAGHGPHAHTLCSPIARSRVDVDIGKFVKIAISHEVVQLLSGQEFGNCVETFGNNADFDHCMYAKLYQLMMEQVGCTVPWLPDKLSICTDETKRKKAFDIYQQNRRNQRDICPNSCLFTTMYFGPPVTGDNGPDWADSAWAVFYFRRDIKTTNEYILYTKLSMLAEIGGYVGLLLGASLAKLGTLNSMVLDFCFGRRKKKIKRTPHLKRIIGSKMSRIQRVRNKCTYSRNAKITNIPNGHCKGIKFPHFGLEP